MTACQSHSPQWLWQGRTERDVLPLVFGQRPVQYGMRSDGPIQVELYICNPLDGFASKARQYTYVNGRYVAGDAASKLLIDLFQQVQTFPVHHFHNLLIVMILHFPWLEQPDKFKQACAFWPCQW